MISFDTAADGLSGRILWNGTPVFSVNGTGVTALLKMAIPAATANGDAVQLGQFIASLGASGSYTFPNGLIIKWGVDTITTAAHTVSFNTPPFPTGCYSCVVSGVAGGAYFIPYTTAITASGYTQGFFTGAGASGNTTSWYGTYIAIGH